MKYFTNRCLIAAAAFVVVAGSASAEVLKVEIPFAFRVGKAMMAPGMYHVFTGGSKSASGHLIRLSNFDMSSNALIMATAKQDVEKEWLKSGVPKLAFDAVDGRYELTKIWDGADGSAFMLPRGRGTRETAGATTITVNAIKAE